MKILVMGPQGSGKSVQAKILSRKYGLCQISSGDLAREKAQEKSEIGRKFKEALDKGEMVDDAILGSIIREKIASGECQEGFVMDGYPRRMSQIEFFDPKPDFVFYLEVSEAESINRLVTRGRADDTPQLILQRLKLYQQRTKPVIDYYQNMGKLIKIDGEQAIDSVTAEVSKYLKK